MPVWNLNNEQTVRFLFTLLTLVLTGNIYLRAGAEAAGDSVIAFPGAEGFGKYTTGGRGGKVSYCN